MTDEFAALQARHITDQALALDRGRMAAVADLRDDVRPGRHPLVAAEHRVNSAAASAVAAAFRKSPDEPDGAAQRGAVAGGVPAPPGDGPGDPGEGQGSAPAEVPPVGDGGAGDHAAEGFDGAVVAAETGPPLGPEDALPGVLAGAEDPSAGETGKVAETGEAPDPGRRRRRAGLWGAVADSMRRQGARGGRRPWRIRSPVTRGQAVLAGSVIVVFAVLGFTLLGPPATVITEPVVPPPAVPTLESTPGGSVQRDSPEYRDTLADSNDQGAAQALLEQQSFLPTAEALPEPIGVGGEPLSGEPEPDSLDSPFGGDASLPPETASWSVAAESGLGGDGFVDFRPAEQPEGFAPAVIEDAFNPMIDHLAALAERPLPRMGQQRYAPPPASPAAAVAGTPAVPTGGVGEVASPLPALRPGDTAPARMLTGLNSDLPGPAIAEIVDGPLTGARLSGSFTVVRSAGGLSLTFDSMSLADGRSVPVSAIGLSPWTGGGVTRSRLDPRLLQRYGGLALSGAVSGAAQAMGRSTGRTTVAGGAVVVDVDEASEREIIASSVGRVAGAVEADLAGRMPDGALITLDAGAPVVVLFTAPLRPQGEGEAPRAAAPAPGPEGPNPALPPLIDLALRPAALPDGLLPPGN